jgi:uncharacterized cupin superfamily protein
MSNIVIKQLSDDEIDKMGILNWPIWTCKVSEFPWKYDVEEFCLILKGEVSVAAGLDTVQIKKGDFIIFPKGLSCVWNVTKPVRKHYQFGE